MLVLTLITLAVGIIQPNTSGGTGLVAISSNAGVVSDYIFLIITEIGASSGNNINIVFPPEYQDIKLGTNTCYVSGISTTCTQSGTSTVVLKLPILILSSSRYTIRVPKIQNPSSTTTSYFKLYFSYPTSNQIIDMNDAFATIHIGPSMTSATGSITSSSNQVGAISAYTIQLKIQTALQSGSLFQILIPSDYSFVNTSCGSTSVSTISIIPSPFACYVQYGNLIISGLSQTLASGTGVAFKFYLNNPSYIKSANDDDFEIRTMVGGSSLVLDSSLISSDAIVEGYINNVAQAAYSSYAYYVSGVTMYTYVSFTTSNYIEDGGSISINYGTTVNSNLCATVSGLSMNSNSLYPACTVSGNSITITQFGAVAKRTKISVLNQLTISSVSNLIITTKNSNGVNIDKSTTGGGITLNSNYNKLSFISARFNIISGRTGSISISLKSTSPSNANAIIISLPTSLKLSSGIICNINTVAQACVSSGNLVTINPNTVTCSSGCSIVLDPTGTKITFPTLGTSYSNILEVSAEVDFASTKEFGVYSATLASSGYQYSSLKSATTQSTWSVYNFTLGLSNSLNSFATNPYISIVFTGYTQDLGTGYTTSTQIGSNISGLTSIGPSGISCILTPGTNPTISITSFNNISAGATVSIKIMVLNPTTTGSILVNTGYISCNNINTVTDTITFPITFASSPTAWPSITGTKPTVSSVGSLTSISFSLQATSPSSVNDILIVSLPSGYNVSTATGSYSGYGLNVLQIPNTYLPSLVLTLSTANVITSTSATTIKIQVTNGGYSGIGNGKISIGFVRISDWTLVNYGTVTDGSNPISYPAFTSNTLISAHYDNSNNYMSAGDVLYKFYLNLNNPVPSTGTIIISFGSGFVVSTSYCIFDYNLGTSATCTVSGSNVIVSGFNSLAANANIYIKVYNVINPGTSSTGTINLQTQYTSLSTSVIDTYSISATKLLTGPGIYNVTISTYTFFPLSTGSYGELTLEFSMETSVPKTGTLTIKFPSGFVLPAISASNCYFNQQFSSCSSSSNTLTITPFTTFSAGIALHLKIPSVLVPGNLTTPISITSTYSGITLSQLSSEPGPLAYFTSKNAATVVFIPSVTITPNNLGEVAIYNFSIVSPISYNDSLVIWFSSSFPHNLGDVSCYSSASALVDQSIGCSIGHTGAVVATGLSSSNFYFAVYGINNPGTSGSIGSIILQIVSSSNEVKSYGTVDGSIAATPSSILIKSIKLSSYTIQDVTTYIIITEIPGIPTTIWYDFPREYTNEIFGIGDNYTCSSTLLDNSGNEVVWTAGTPRCVNTYYNRIALSATGSGSVSGSYLKTTIGSVKSSSIIGTTHYFKVTLLNQMTVLGRTYDYDINHQTTFISDREPIIINTVDGVISMNSGVSCNFMIYTASSKVVAKEDLTFSYSISSLNSISGITIAPSPLILTKSSYSTAFTITCTSSVLQGNYIIKWGVSSSKYLQPKYTLLKIDPSVVYTVTVSNIPVLVYATVTIPITITSEAAPTSNLMINTIPSTGLVLTPIIIGPGSFSTTYTINTTEITTTLTTTTGLISFSLQGDNSRVFVLDSSSVLVSINIYDTVIPYIVSFVVNSPRHKTFIEITLQASEPCMFYYTFGPRGLHPPTNTSLIANSSLGVSGYYLCYVGATHYCTTVIAGLVPEHDYILYGILADVSGNVMASVFSINLFTADLDSSVLFTLEFSAPYPSPSQLSNEVINALSYQFVVPTSRLQLLSYTNSSANYELLYSNTTDDPSPENIIMYTGIPVEINRQLSGISLLTNFSLKENLTVVFNPRPTWSYYPVTNSTSKDSVTMMFGLTYNSIIYAEIIADSDTVPSSRQVVSGLDAYNQPANITFSKYVPSGNITTITFGGLQPTSSYILVMSLKNTYTPSRYMSDEYMAAINFITQAGTIGNATSNSTNSFGTRVKVVLVGLIVMMV